MDLALVTTMELSGSSCCCACAGTETAVITAGVKAPGSGSFCCCAAAEITIASAVAAAPADMCRLPIFAGACLFLR